MKQYCRYCAHCFLGDVLYCGEKEKILGYESAKRVNHCKSFAFLEDDALFENPRPYKPHKSHRIHNKSNEKIEKMKLNLEEDNESD